MKIRVGVLNGKRVDYFKGKPSFCSVSHLTRAWLLAF